MTATCLIVLGAVSLAYGLAMAALYPAGGFFLVWVLLGAVGLALGMVVRAGVWALVPLAVRVGAVAAGLAFALAVGAGVCLIARAASAPVPAGLDYLIVLGAQVDARGRPKEALRYRLEAAAGYLAENPDARCVVSGGQGADEPCSEASAMAAFLVDAGIDEGRIVEEADSTSTSENLRFSLRRIEGEGADASVAVGVVTNNFHVLRALSIAKAEGFTNAYGVAAGLSPLYLPQATLRECAALAWGVLRGSF